MDNYFEEIEHTADIAIRVWGRDRAELFAHAAYGMACQLADPDEVDQIVEELIELETYDAETLLVAWLEELLYLGEREECIFTNFEMIEVTPTYLRAVAWGGSAPEYWNHIKAVTFSEMNISCSENRCETTIVFDV